MFPVFRDRFSFVHTGILRQKESDAVSASSHFYTMDMQSLFQTIGSADRGLLLEMGLNPGDEYRAPTDEEEDEYYAEPEEKEPGDWDPADVEQDTSREIISKLIMSGMPSDLSEDETYAVQDFLASHALRAELAQPIQTEDLIEAVDIDDWDDQVADPEDELRVLVDKGAARESLSEFVGWLREQEASNELISRVQIMYLGRLPDSEDPAFSDLMEEAFEARFGYIYAEEAAQIVDEMQELAPKAIKEHGPLGLFLLCLLHYSNTEAADLLISIEE